MRRELPASKGDGHEATGSRGCVRNHRRAESRGRARVRNGRTTRRSGARGVSRSVRGSSKRCADKDTWVKVTEEGGKDRARKKIAHRVGGLECEYVCVSTVYLNNGFKVFKGILCKD